MKKANQEFKAYLKKHDIKKSEKKAYQTALKKFPLVKPIRECLDLPDDAYDDGAFANCAMDQMEKLSKGDRPFFLAVGFKKPHLPFIAPKKFWDLYDRSKIQLAPFQEAPKGAPEYAYQDSWELSGYTGIPTQRPFPEEFQRELIHGYRACVSYVDTQIGKILDKLQETGLAENTVIVLWGDHGWHLGDHGIWCKHTNYEQATHSPLIIFAPKLPRPGKSDSMVESVDIFPTLCELASLPIPQQLEGSSLVPILRNSEAKVKEFSMSQYPDHHKKGLMGYAMRTERYRFVMWVNNNFRSTQQFDESLIADLELYDYQTDPLETVSQANNPEYKAVVADLQQKMVAYFKKYEQ